MQARQKSEVADGFRADLPILALEVGNDVAKAASTDFSFRSAFTTFRHRFAELEYGDYKIEADSAQRNGDPAYHLIEWRKRYFVIGDEAARFPGFLQQRQNTDKWERDYIGLFNMSALLRLYEGNPPEVLTMYVAHPPRFYDQTDRLLASVLGKWSFATPSGSLKLNVAYAEPYDEIVGGVMNQSLNTDGTAYAQGTNPILGKGPTLVADLGGGTFDLAYLRKDGTVDYQRMQNASETIGGNDAFENFRRAVSRRYKSLIRGGEKGSGVISQDDAFQILLHDRLAFEAVGDEYPCEEEFDRAFNPIITACKGYLDRRVPNFLGLNYVLVTGGVYGLLYERMNKVLFPEFNEKGRVFPVDRRGDMYLGNIRGAYKMSLTKLLTLGAKVKRK